MTPSQFARLMAEDAASGDRKLALGARAALTNLHREAYQTFGDRSRLRGLAESTQAQRVAAGYTPNDPVLASGSERETLGMAVLEDVPGTFEGSVGSDDPQLLWQERGTIRMAPIPVLSAACYAASTRYEEIVSLIGRAMLDGMPGLAAMLALLAFEKAQDTETEASRDA